MGKSYQKRIAAVSSYYLLFWDDSHLLRYIFKHQLAAIIRLVHFCEISDRFFILNLFSEYDSEDDTIKDIILLGS